MTQSSKILSLRNAVAFFRQSIGATMPLQQLQALLEVGAQPGLSTAHLCERLGIPGGSLSRNMLALEAKGLVRIERGAENRRQLVYFLTEHGATVVQEAGKRLLLTEE